MEKTILILAFLFFSSSYCYAEKTYEAVTHDSFVVGMITPVAVRQTDSSTLRKHSLSIMNLDRKIKDIESNLGNIEKRGAPH